MGAVLPSHVERFDRKKACGGIVKANEYSRFSALNSAERGGNSRAKQWSSSPPWCASRQYRIYSDGVDVARAASGSMKSRAKMVVVETTSEGEDMGRAAAVWHH